MVTILSCKEDRDQRVFMLYSVSHLKRYRNYYTEYRHVRNDETSGSVEFLQPYAVAAEDALLEIGMAVSSAVLLLEEHLMSSNTSCILKFC
jgi:hypothetical protein